MDFNYQQGNTNYPINDLISDLSENKMFNIGRGEAN
jgi:hypothetical protein